MASGTVSDWGYVWRLGYFSYCGNFQATHGDTKDNSGTHLGTNRDYVCLSRIMASGPITSWEIDGETVETLSNFIFFGSKITADGDCSHEIKRRLLLGRKVMTNLR